jgi:hypothetical protein
MEMNKISMTIKYKIGYQLSWAILSLAIYVITMFLIFYLLIKFSVLNHTEGSLVYRLWVLVIFQFAVSMRFNEDFDFLLTLSNTRNDIFQALIGVAFGFSVFFSGLIVLERLIVDYLNNVLKFHNIVDPFHFIAPYGTDNLFMQFVFFLALCVCLSIFGLLMGSLFYRYGKKFTLAFWLVFSSIPTVFFPLLLWVFYLRGHLAMSLTAMGEFLRYFDIMVASVILFALSIVLGTTAWLNIRRLPQK